MPEIPIWHVAILGKPVGPLRRSDLVARLRSGEIEPSSLAWREGQADWQALSAIPELAKLVAAESPRASHVPPAGAFGPAGVAPRVTPAPPHVEPAAASPSAPRTSNPPASVARVLESVPPSKPASVPPPDDEPELTMDEPAESEAAMAAIAHTAPSDPSARNAAMAELAARAIAASREGAPAAVASPRVSEPPQRPLELSGTDRDLPPIRDKGRSPAFWAMVAGATAFGVVFAWFAAQKAFGPSQPTAEHTAPNASTAATRPATPRSAIAATSVEDVGDDEFAMELAGLDAGTRAATPTAPVATTGTRSTTPRESTGSTSEALPMPVSIGATMTGTASTTTGAPSAEGLAPLQPQQMTAVVRRNLPRAQRCYEIAANMMGRAPDLRLAITVRVSPAGAVTSVDIDGEDFGGVQACVRRSVMTWVFPPSSTGGQTTIPMVIAGSN